MDQIKIRTKGNKTIKTLNKVASLTDKMKDTIVFIKDRPDIISNNENEKDFGNSKIEETSKRGLIVSKNLTKRTIKKAPKKIKDGTVKTVKVTRKTIKSSKKIIDTSIKVAKKTYQITKQLAKLSIKAIKLTIKAIVSAIKGIIAGTKALVSAIAAGGWVAVVIIIVICIIGLICASIFGVFTCNETGGITMTEVIRETNSEMYQKIENEKLKYEYDDVNIESSYSNWNEVIAVYSVKYSSDGSFNVSLIDDSNKQKIKNVFWDFNEIHSSINKNELKKVLTIRVISKSKEDIMDSYAFNDIKRKQVNELLSKKYDSLWRSLIYGSLSGNKQIVEIAKQQVGNVGGEPYWRWYGFNNRIEWCAVFVSWVANEAGVLNDMIPKFSGVKQGIEWFKSRGEWQNKGYIPRPGDIIFFDWEVDGLANHVGIVEKVENGYIYTIEGNSTDDGCREKKYKINQKEIYGFGVPNY